MSRAAPPDLDIYCGSATPELAQLIADRLGRLLGKRQLDHFPDGELHVQIQESVRGRDIYIVQSTSPPVNEHLMELLVMIDACHRASAGRITAILPYYGYARQEKKTTGREPITAKLVANLLAAAGANRVAAIDLHSSAIQGFFDIEMIHLTAIPLLANHLRSHLDLRESVLVSPDTGRVKAAERYANLLDVPIVVMHKRRSGKQGEEVEVGAGMGQGGTERIARLLLPPGKRHVPIQVTLGESAHYFIHLCQQRIKRRNQLSCRGRPGQPGRPAIQRIVLQFPVPPRGNEGIAQQNDGGMHGHLRNRPVIDQGGAIVQLFGAEIFQRVLEPPFEAASHRGDKCLGLHVNMFLSLLNTFLAAR
jgi:hypothetical protein